MKPYSLDRAAYDLDLPQARLRKALEALGVESVDVLEAIRARQAREPVYVPLDTHWNAIGNAIAAEALAAHFSAPGSAPLVPK